MSESQPASFMLGKYRLIAELGRGGMAEVYLALANPGVNFAKLVVIKKPREHLASDAEFMTMLMDEARIAARLNHPNLVQTIEVSEAEGEQFLTMEYLDGQPLVRVLYRVRSTFPTDMHLSILADVCAGIHYAHELKDFDGTSLNVVHRDVTPHNVFVTYEGQVKVVDFGIAKAVGRAGETRHGVVKGKTPYMAPEQACGKEVDRRVDIFSVGVMIYEAAIRRRMWKGLTEIDIIRNLVAGKIPSSPREVDPSVDEALDAICQRALAVSPDDRYSTAADMQEDLEAYLSQIGRPSPRAVGAFCAELFADKREMTNKIIEKQLAYLKSASSQRSLPTVPGSTETPSSDSDGILITFDEVFPSGPVSRTPANPKNTPLPRRISSSVAPRYSDPPTRTTASDTDSRLAATRTWWKRPIVFAALLLAACTTSATVLVLGLLNGHLAPAAGSVSESVTITLRATPLETRFTIDDGPPLENPFLGQYPRDGRQHKIAARAAGHAPMEETVVFQSDVSLRFALASDAKK